MEGSVLVVNCGSSSLKLALYENAEATIPTTEATAERLGTEQASLTVSGDLKQRLLQHDGDITLRLLGYLASQNMYSG